MRLRQPGQEGLQGGLDRDLLLVAQDGEQDGDNVFAVAALLVGARAVCPANAPVGVQGHDHFVRFVFAPLNLGGDRIAAPGELVDGTVAVVALAAGEGSGVCAGTDVGFGEGWHLSYLLRTTLNVAQFML